MEKLSLDPSKMELKEKYKFLIGSILPRPIGFISTISTDGLHNLAPFSFFNGVCSNPPTILFCPVLKSADGTEKDTLKNIRDTKEFGVNIVSYEIAEQMNITAGEYPSTISEFDKSQLTPEKGKIIKAPIVKESKINMECKLTQVVDIGTGIGSGSIVIGEVVYFHINNDIYSEGKIDLKELNPIGRLSGSEYCKITDSFSIERPN